MSTKQNTLWTVVLAIASVFTGCINDHDEPSPDPEGNSLIINFTLPANGVRTRSVAAETGENNINDLTLLFFTPSTNGTGTYAGHYRVPAENIPDEGSLLGEENNKFNLQIKFDSSMGISISDAYSVLAFANMEGNYFSDIETEFDDLITLIHMMKEIDVWNYFTLQVSGVGTSVEDQTNNSQAMRMTNLPMSASFQKEKEQNVVDCKLIRSVVRFDIVNNTTGYKLVSASIWNAFPKTTIWEKGTMDYNQTHLKRYYGVRDEENGFEEIKGGLYCFENISTQPAQNDEKTTCLILGLQPGGGGNISYYRVNVSPQVTGQYLQRNNVYQVTITKVNSEGAATEYDAYKGGRLLLDVTINGWDRDEEGLIIRNGEYMLVIPTTRAVFGAEAEDRQYYVYTSGEGTLELNKVEMPSGMDAWLVDNNLFMRVSEYALEQRKGVIELRFAGMKGTIEMVQSGLLDKYLKLSRVIVDDWPAGPSGEDKIASDPIVINSSGPWTAEIYNGNFSFSSGNDQSTLRGNDGDAIRNIYTTSVNDEVADRTSFVLVSLDDDPDHYRNVIVLKQSGRGGFTLNPNYTNITFEPDGSLSSLTENTDNFTVTPGENTDTWKAEIINDPKSAFSIEYGSGNNINGDVCTGSGTFTVKCNGNNYNEEATATVRITHNGSNTKTIQVKQDYYYVRLAPSSVSAIPAGGGMSGFVKVTSNYTGGLWDATVTSSFTNFSGESASFMVGNVKQPSLSSQALESDFRVYMPGIDSHVAENPFAEVTVTIGQTPLEAKIRIGQENVTYIPLYAHTFRHDYLATWSSNVNTDNYRVFGQWANELRSSANFGPSGQVFTQTSSINVTDSWGYDLTYGAAKIRQYNPRIFNMNAVASSVAKNPTVSLVRGDPNNVYIISQWEYTTDNAFMALEVSGYSIAAMSTIDKAIARTLTTNTGSRNTLLWEYLMDGPFGQVTPENVVLYPRYYFEYMYCLTAWPDTFIPLMYHPNNPAQVLLGVDPTNRLIYIGHKDLFGTDGNPLAYSSNWTNPDNVTFLRNLIAWTVNVANYGNAFTDQFK